MYGRFVGRYAPSLAAALIGAAGLEPSDRVLDVGCGPGGLATALAEVVGQENVAAIDPSPPFASVCRARLPLADVRVGAAEELPFDDDSFDAAFAQLVVNFMDARRAVARADCAMGRVRLAYSANVPVGRVISQSPAREVLRRELTRVRLVVSRGPRR